MKGVRNVDKYTYQNDIGRTSGIEVSALAAAWKAAKVLPPVAGALMEPTIPGP
jgi:hypothetical protein